MPLVDNCLNGLYTPKNLYIKANIFVTMNKKKKKTNKSNQVDHKHIRNLLITFCTIIA